MAEFGPKSFDARVVEAVEAVLAVVRAGDTSSETAVKATENALSSAVKLALFRGHAITGDGPAPLVKAMLSLLPISTDQIEAVTLHGLVVRALAAGHPLVGGHEWANLGSLLRLFAEVLGAGGGEEGAAEAGAAGAGAGGDEDDDEDDEDEEDAALASPETKALMVEWLRQAQRGAVPGEVLGRAFAELQPAQQMVLAKAVGS